MDISFFNIRVSFLSQFTQASKREHTCRGIKKPVCLVYIFTNRQQLSAEVLYEGRDPAKDCPVLHVSLLLGIPLHPLPQEHTHTAGG